MKRKKEPGWNMVEAIENLSPKMKIGRTAMGMGAGPLLWDARRISDKDAAALNWFLHDLGWWPLFRIERGWAGVADYGFESPLHEESIIDVAALALERRKRRLGWKRDVIKGGLAAGSGLLLMGIGHVLGQLQNAAAGLLAALVIAVVLALIAAARGLLGEFFG